MCVLSMIGDDYNNNWPTNPLNPYKNTPVNPFNDHPVVELHLNKITRDEFDALKKEVEALRDLLKAAKIYDEATGQKDCEMGDKVALIKKLAELVGVDLEDIFNK